MIDIECIIDQCLDIVLNFNEGRAVLLFSLSAILFSFYKVHTERKTKQKLSWVYALIFSFLFPLFFIAFSMTCQMGISCAGSAIFYSLPLSFVIALIVGYVIIPFIYMRLRKNHKLSNGSLASFVENTAADNNIRKPGLYAFDSIEPEAFSYSFVTPIIMISTRMMEMLTRKEVEAVLLHELGHLKGSSSIYRFAAFFVSHLPFLSRAVDVLVVEKGEEELADRFAAKIQRTSRHIRSARRKISEYHRMKGG
jgi:Zn-dependent protease with chaperone function